MSDSNSRGRPRAPRTGGIHPDEQLQGFRVVTTGDGSQTLVNPEGLSYRSLSGAQTESLYVFVEGAGLPGRNSPWRVLELGFGIGTNFVNTHRCATRLGVELHYVAVDCAPPPISFAYEADPLACALLDPKGTGRAGRIGIEATLLRGDWATAKDPGRGFHAVFHDPFGPRENPNAWSEGCFRWSYERLAGRGVLATYSAATSVRRHMNQAGYQVAMRPGPGRKREVTVAAKRRDVLTALGARLV